MEVEKWNGAHAENIGMTTTTATAVTETATVDTVATQQILYRKYELGHNYI